jgi:hypothetical protein
VTPLLLLALLVAAIPPILSPGIGGNKPNLQSLTIHGLARDGEPDWAVRQPDVVVDDGHARPIPEIIASYPWPAETALAIAWCESRYRADAVNPQAVWIGGRAHHASGVFQLLMPLHAWRLAGGDPFDAEANIRAAYGLWREQGWGPWRACW